MDVVQPVLWAVMVALAAAWQWLGVTPAAVAGTFAGGDRGGVRGGRPVAGGRGEGRGAAQPDPGRAGRAGRDAVGGLGSSRPPRARLAGIGGRVIWRR